MSDRDAQIAEMYRQGYTYVQIGAQIGMARTTVRDHCAKLGLTTELPRKSGAVGKDDPRASAGYRVIGERLRAWLAETGKPPTTAAEEMGISKSSFCYWVRGDRPPNRIAASAIEQYFGQPEGALYAGTGFRPYRPSGNAHKASQRACRCCEVLLDREPESSTRGLCVWCATVAIPEMQRKGFLRETNLLAAAHEWRELATPSLREQLWLEECADAGIEAMRTEMMAEL